MATKKKEEIVDWSQYQSTGFENVQQSDLGIPFLVILQKLSPEIDEDHPQHESSTIEGCGVGDIVNTVSREIIHKANEDPLIVVPFSYRRAWVEWTPRESGGGIVKTHTTDAILRETQRNEKNQDVLPNGNIIVTTAYFFVLIGEGEEAQQAVISLTGTQLKKARGWLNLASNNKQEGNVLPMFSRRYALSTIAESNEKGSWRGWKVELGDPVTDSGLIRVAAENSKTAARSLLAIGDSTQDDEIPV